MISDEVETDLPNKCPKCGSVLEERSGKFGKFLVCKIFPEFRYTFDLRN